MNPTISRTILSFVILTVMTSLPLGVYGQCERACRLPARSERGECSIVVDANTGAIVQGSIRIPDRCDQVQVYYVNKNPIKYSYSFSSKFVAFDTEAALAFLKLIPGFGETVKTLTETASVSPAASACQGADLAKATQLRSRANALNDKFKEPGKQLADNVNSARKLYTDYKNHLTVFFDKTSDDNAFAWNGNSCELLCKEANDRLAEYAQLPDLDGLAEQVSNFEQKVASEADLAKLESDIQAFQPAGANAEDCKTETREAVLKVINEIKGTLKTAKDRLAELQKAKETLDQRTKIVRTGASDSFVEVMPAQRDDVRGGKLTLTIARKNLRNPDSKLDDRSVVLLIGEPNLFLTAGIGFSTVSDRRVIRQAALVPNGSGGTKLGTVFGFEENSNFKPSGVFMLTAPLKKFNNGMTIGPSAGLVLSARNNTVEPEFIAGLSLGLLRNTVFISGGFHAARREALSSGFKIGQEVPADLKDPLPLEKRFTGGAMFAITYRIR